jgi:VWFA-related protein
VGQPLAREDSSVGHTATRFAAALLVAFGVFWVCAAPLAPPGIFASGQEARQDPPPQQQPPKFRVDANFVRVDAYPLKDGKPLLGLRAEDFEVYEDGAVQKIESFEHVVVRPAGPQEDRIEVSSQRESLQAAANPRNRVFIIFLDTPHVMVDSAHRMNEPLIRLIDKILGPDDLVGVMTPAMAASQIVLGRKTRVIEESLRANWAWGKRFTFERDEREHAYLACYPPMLTERGPESALAVELIKRKRERATLDALEDLVRYLRTIRDERKAILTVTEGWLLFRPDEKLTKLREDPFHKEAVPTLDPITVGPTGTLTTRDTRNIGGNLTKAECDADRLMLAAMDNRQFFRDILDEANYANASFYPIDPRGLPVFDNPIGPDPPPPLVVDHAMLRQRIEAMQTLAENTDGMAVINNNDLDKGLRRIADDLTSYYLLGYSSTNTKLDGRFRVLKVRVKQPGVTVRARRGYKAATEKEVTAARRAADAPVPEATAAATAAIDRLSRMRPDARFRINAASGVGPDAKIWVAGELQAPTGKPDEFSQGATVDIEAMGGSAPTTARVTLKAGERTFLTTLSPPAGSDGDLNVRARITAEGGGPPLTETIRLSPRQPLIYRRGLTTANRLLPAADFRFSRTERVRVEIPVGPDAKPGEGRVLDRAGQPLPVRVTTAERADETSGQRFVTADIVLAALSNGDYVVELQIGGSAAAERVLTAIRIVR